MPPSIVIGKTVEAQPGTASSVNRLTHSTHADTAMAQANTTNPVTMIICSGTVENEVIACMASCSILLSGYFDAPAKRSLRSYSTVVPR